MTVQNRFMRVPGIILSGALMTAATLAIAAGTTNYNKIPPDMLAEIEATEAAFMAKDLDRVAVDLADDYSWYKIDDQGPQKMVSGRAATLELLDQFFSNDGGWTSPEVHRLGWLGNMFVQVEVDHFDTPEGRKTVRSLNIYELKDGKRWREWKFYPAE